MTTNAPARAVYTRAGFRPVAERRDMFRIDGESVADVEMTLALGPPPA